MKALAHGGIFAGILLAALLLAGCSGPAGVAEKVERGLPSTLADAQGSAIPPAEPSALWLEDGNRCALITWGSSSCPAVVTRMEATGAGAIGLRVESSGGSGPCSAGLAPRMHELAVPESVTGRPVTLTLKYPEAAAAKTLVLR